MAKNKESDENKSNEAPLKVAKFKKAKPEMPKIYQDGQIEMQSAQITDKEAFFSLWKGTRNAKGVNLDKAWNRAKAWKGKFE